MGTRVYKRLKMEGPVVMYMYLCRVTSSASCLTQEVPFLLLHAVY